MDLAITDDGVRPVGPQDQCFYCQSPKGEHKEDCVCVNRSIVVRMAVEYVVSVPRSWDVDLIEFQRNEGSWCANNDLDRLAERAETGDCVCGVASFNYVREATAEDHEKLPDLSKAT